MFGAITVQSVALSADKGTSIPRDLLGQAFPKATEVTPHTPGNKSMALLPWPLSSHQPVELIITRRNSASENKAQLT